MGQSNATPEVAEILDEHCRKHFGFGLLDDSISFDELVSRVSSRIFVFHFHIYCDVTPEELENPDAVSDLLTSFQNAKRIKQEIVKMREAGLIQVDVGPIYLRNSPLHPKPSFEVQVQKESLATIMEFVMMNIGTLNSVLIHPNAVNDVKNHGERVASLGEPLKFAVNTLEDQQQKVAAFIEKWRTSELPLNERKATVYKSLQKFLFPTRYGVVEGYRNQKNNKIQPEV